MAGKNEQAIIEVIIRGQAANATLKDIQASARALSAQMRRLPVDSKEFAEKSAELKKVNTRLKDIKDMAGSTGNAFAGLGKSIMAGLGPAAIILVLIGKIVTAIGSAKNTLFEFDSSMKDFQAITGASAEDLEYYGKSARNLGKDVQGGARSVVEAYKLIGSAKPELLQNKEALNEVAKSAILLAQATGLELPEAATRLTDALNQYGAPAKDAAKYTDALAAASKYGAAEVPQVTEALLKFGTQAKSANIDIFQSAAAIELLAEKGLKGAEAGTMLRNVFTKLNAAEVLPASAKMQLEDAGVNISILQNKSLSLSDRLKELSKIQGDAAAIAKVFGMENQAAGEILISNIPRLEQLAKQVKEVGVAQEQAAIRMSKYEQATIRAGNAWDSLLISMDKGTSGEIIAGVFDSITAKIQQWSTALTVFNAFMDQTGSKIFNKEQVDELERLGVKLEFVNGTVVSSQEIFAQYAKEFYDYNTNLKKMNLDEANRAELLKDLKIKQEVLTDYYQSGRLTATQYAAALRLLSKSFEMVSAASTQALESPTGTPPVIAQIGIIKGLQEEIAALTEKRADSVSRIEIRSLNEQIKRKQEALNELLGIEKNHTDKLAEAHKRLLEELEKMNFANKIFNLEKFDQEFEKIWKSWQENMDKINSDDLMNAVGHEEEKSRAIQIVTKKRDLEIQKLTSEHFDAVNKETAEHLKNQRKLMQDAEQNELDDIDEKFQKEIDYIRTSANILNKDTTALEEARQKERLEVIEKYAKMRRDAEMKHEDDIFRATHEAYDIQIKDINDQYDRIIEAERKGQNRLTTIQELEEGRRRALAKASHDQQKKDMQDLLNSAQPFITEFTNIMNLRYQINRNIAEAEAAQEEKAYQDKLAREKRMFQYRTTSNEEYNRRIAELELEHESNVRLAKQKQFIADKKNARANAVMNGAQAVMKTYANMGFTPAAHLLAAAGAAETIMQIRLINTQVQPYAKGGYHDPAGYVNKETLFSSSSGVPFIAGEAGAEWIAPNWMLQNPITASAIRQLEGVRQNRSFASGGSTATSTGTPGSFSAPNTTNTELTAAINRLNDNLENGIGLNYDVFTRTLKSIESARDGSRVN